MKISEIVAILGTIIILHLQSRAIKMKILEIAATLGTIISLYLISKGVAIGFAIGGFASILWLSWGYAKDSFGIMLTNLILLAINANALVG